jgi:hypothetical protein
MSQNTAPTEKTRARMAIPHKLRLYIRRYL